MGIGVGHQLIIAAGERTQSLPKIPSRLADVGEAIPLLMTHSIEPWLLRNLSEVTIGWVETQPRLPLKIQPIAGLKLSDVHP